MEGRGRTEERKAVGGNTMQLNEQQFAVILDKAVELREASWRDNHYTKQWEQCCIEAGASKAWAEMMGILLFPGYCDVWDWTAAQRKGE